MASESETEKVVLKFTTKIQGKLLDPETKQEKVKINDKIFAIIPWYHRYQFMLHMHIHPFR